MKKIVIFFALLIASINANSQSVLGIPFGSKYSVVKKNLEERFGSYHLYEDEGKLIVLPISVGGFDFNGGEFYFQRANGTSYFNSARFDKFFDGNDVKLAERSRDYLYSLLKDKYSNDYLEEYENDDGFKCYKFGTNPKNTDNVLGFIRLLRYQKDNGKTGFCLTLEYGPIYYVDKASDF